MALVFVLAAVAAAALSGLPACLPGGAAAWGRRLGGLLSLAAAGSGLAAASLVLARGPAQLALAPSDFPGGSLSVSLDALSAWFLVPVSLVPGLGSVYADQYWRPDRAVPEAHAVPLFYGLLTAGMMVLLVARNTVLFLVGWETMALAAFFLVGADTAEPDGRKAAWVYFVATHIGTVALMALFVLMRQESGSPNWAPIPADALPAAVGSMFLLALLGFGLKAGIMPLHIWLPSAHASAPSHVSAVMSGVMLKMGVYGIVRFVFLVQEPPLWWASLLMSLGIASCVLGALSALVQHDMKRMLAYSSIENIGIVTVGIGLAQAGRTLHQPSWLILGLSAALLHVLNHSLFKSLLFFGAGSVVHAAGSRRLDRLGGLAKAMPWTFVAWTVGILALCLVPGLNGLPGELSLYLGLLRVSTDSASWVAVMGSLCAVGLALSGALVLAGFVRALAAIFLGTARSASAEGAHESPRGMTGVMGVLVVLCLTSGLAPFLSLSLLDRIAGSLAPKHLIPSLALIGPWRELSGVALASLGLMAALGWWMFRGSRRSTRGVPRVGTWDCGYGAPLSPRIQYTASSFAAPLVSLFGPAVAPVRSRPEVAGLFPGSGTFWTRPVERVLATIVVPAFQDLAQRFVRLRILQQGRIHIYLVYVLIVFMLGIAVAALSSWSAG